jgi:hypothetical protein
MLACKDQTADPKQQRPAPPPAPAAPVVPPQLESSAHGSIHSEGGKLGTWDVEITDCESGEVKGFFGVDLYGAGSDHLRLRYVHDEAAGEIVKVAYPDDPTNVNQFDREDACTTLEGHVEKTNVRSWTPKGNIVHVNGHVKFDCKHTDSDGSHVTGDVTFMQCH